MPIFHACAIVSLSLWVGGVTFGVWRHEASEAPVDRWGTIWGASASLFLYMVFAGRHFLLRSLALELPVAVMFLLTLHGVMVLHPQIADLRRQMADPKYAATARLLKLKYCFDRLHLRSGQLRGAILFLGWFSLALTPKLL